MWKITITLYSRSYPVIPSCDKLSFRKINNTVLENLYKNNKYKLVNLWSVIEVIKKASKYGELFIGLSDENLSYKRMPFSCKKCNKKLHKAIENFNKTQNIDLLNNLTCSCKKDYEYKLNKGLI